MASVLKPSPETETEVALTEGKDFEEEISDLIGDIRKDETARMEWLEKQDRFYKQRYSLEHRNPTFPWVGSSDVVMPLTDLLVERLKSGYMGVLKQRPLVTFDPQDPGDAASKKAKDAELSFDYLLNFQVNDFRKQLQLGFDSILQYGIGIYKVYWNHDTMNTTDRVTKKTLPPRFQAVMATTRGTTEAHAAVEMLAAMTRGEQRAPLTPKEFDKYSKEPIPGLGRTITDLIAEEFELDPNDRIEAKSLKSLLSLLRGDIEEAIVKKKTVISSAPRVISIDPRHIIVPAYTTSIEEAPRITHRMFFTETELKSRAKNGIWDAEAVEEILDKGPTADGSGERSLYGYGSANRALREGIMNYQEKDLYEIWEIYTYRDNDGDGLDEKAVITVHPSSKKILKSRELPFKHGQWPFTGIPFELNEDRFYSHRGVPEIVRDFQIEINGIHRAKLNRLLMETSLTWKVRARGHINPSSLRFMPGQVYPVQQMDDLQEVQMSSKSMNFQEEENILRAWVEQRIGATDFALNSPTGSSNDARTAREISALQATTERQQSVRQSLLIEGLKRIYGQMWDLWQERGSSKIIGRTTGGATFKATREEIIGNYDIVPNVPVGTFDPAFKAQVDLSTLTLMAQVIGPILAQDERWDLDIGQQAVTLLEDMDIRRARRTIRPRTPEEIQALRQQKAQMQQLQLAQAGADIQVKQADAASKTAGAAKNMAQARQTQAPQNGQLSGLEALLGGATVSQ